MADYDPIDSLIHLHKSVGLGIGSLMEQLQDSYGWADDDEIMADYAAWADGLEKQIKDEMLKHHDGRRRYSTGVPFGRTYEYPSSEPGENGEEVPVIAKATVVMHPDGSPEDPLDGGVWVDR